MPSANGHAPLGARAVAESCKLGPKIHQDGSQNLSSWAPKSTKLGSQIKKNQSWEVSGGVLGPSWPPRGTQDQNIPQNQKFLPPLGHPFWRPKPSQNQFFSVPRGVIFLINFLIGQDRFFKDFNSNLPPKTLPKPSQNRAKLGSKRHPKSKQPKSLKILKTHWFFNKKLGSGHQKINKKSLKIY